MTGPDPRLAAAFTWLNHQRGIDRGQADIHAATLQGYYDRLAHEWRQMRDRTLAAEAAVARLRAALGTALDEAPDLPAFAHAAGKIIEQVPR